MSRFIILLGAILAAGSAVADSRPESITIAEAVTLASARHPSITALEAELRAARALSQQAGVRPAPEVSAGLGYKDVETETGYAVDVELAFPLERSGKRAARMGVAQSEISLAEIALHQLRRDIELQVRTLAYDYLTASADAEIAREIAERSRAMIDLLKQRPTAGPIILLELRVIEGSLVEFQNSAREFEAQRDAARASLNILLDRAEDAPLVLKDDLVPPANLYATPAFAARLEKRPALLKRLVEIERANHEAQAAILEGKPEVSVGPYLSREEAGEAETTVGLAVSMPLSWSSRNQGAIQAAQARREKAEAELKAETLAVRSELARRVRLYAAAVAQVEAVPVSLVESLHEAADLADRQYRLGAIPVQLFLDMQREFLSVQLLRHNAQLESLKMAAELEWLAGSAAGETAP